MAHRDSNRQPIPHPASLKAVAETSAREVLSEIITRLKAGETGRRLVPYCRVSELCPPFKKHHVLSMLKRGELRGIRVGGTTLIELASVDELLARSEAWEPRRCPLRRRPPTKKKRNLE